jgi:transcriptional regulator with XRE-family HTH domain
VVVDKILEFIKENGPSQKILAKKSGIKYKRLNAILHNNGAKMSPEEFFAVYKALGVSPEIFDPEGR